MKRTTARVYLGLVVIEGLGALSQLFRGPYRLLDTFQGFTPTYQILTSLCVGALALVSVVGAWFSFTSGRDEKGFGRRLQRLALYLDSGRRLFWVCAVLVLAGLLAAQFALQKGSLTKAIQIQFLSLMTPVLIWVILFCLQSIPALFVLSGKGSLIKRTDFLRPLGIFTGLLFLWVLISLTGLGYSETSPLSGLFRVTGYPLLGYQVFFAWLGCVSLFTLGRWIWKKGVHIPPGVKDGSIFLLLFLGSLLAWQNVPIEPNAFIDIPRPPNYEYYPNLDAMVYDRTAQNFLTKGAFQSYLVDDYYYGDVGRRPLMALSYAGLHSLAGLGYEEIIPLQIAIFAFLPGLVYWVTKSLHTRASGILTAVLIIIRQRNGLLLGGEVTGSNLHMIMSDLPATMGVVLTLVFFIRWLDSDENRFWHPLISGGALGATMLIRQEAGVLLPFLGLLALLKNRHEWGRVFRNLLLLLAGVVLVISPWIWRNWQKTGHLYFDQPGELNFIIRTIDLIKVDHKKLYHPAEDGLALQRDPLFYPSQVGDKDSAVNGYHLASLNQTWPARQAAFSKSQSTIPALQREPAFVSRDGFAAPENEQDFSDARLVANHLANSFLQSVLYLPSTSVMSNMDYLSRLVNGQLHWSYGGVLYSLENYTSRYPYWKPTWDGTVLPVSLIPLGSIFALIAAGVSVVWKRKRWVGMIPVFAYLAYLSIYTLSQRSGGRFLLEVDWITALFACVGLVEMTGLLFPGVRAESGEGEIGGEWNLFSGLERTLGKKILALLLPLGLLSLGSLPPLFEAFAGNPYTQDGLEERAAFLLESERSPLPEEEVQHLETFLDQGGMILYGRALYPRYFLPEQEMMNTIELYFEAHTTFYLSGTGVEYATLYHLEPPEEFPHGADVLVFGCKDLPIDPGEEQICLHCFNDGFDALAVVIYGEDGKGVENVLWREGERVDLSQCPMPATR